MLRDGLGDLSSLAKNMMYAVLELGQNRAAHDRRSGILASVTVEYLHRTVWGVN